VATSYGVCQVLKAAIEKVGELDDDEIAETLRTMEAVTVFGTYNVDPETGAQKGKELFVIQIQNGKRVVVWPEEEADGDLIFPAPPWNQR
jgi:branched-chain amino acid transport system substrate-binding protein